MWFELKIAVNITNNSWHVYIDDVFLGSFSNGINQIASLDLFPLQGNSFWVDNVSYMYNSNLVYGCADSTMFNYDVNATWDDSTCVSYIYGCTDSTMFNYDVNANTDDGSCIPTVYGCTDLIACNYFSLANIDNGSCNYNSVSYDTLVSNIGIVWNSITLTNSGDYSVVLINSVQCDSIAYLNLTINNTTSILDIIENKKKLVKITDILGQEIPRRRNTPLFYIYNDGTVEKKIILE